MIKFMAKKLLITVCLFIFTLPVFAFEALNFNGFIADNAGVISSSNETVLNQVLLELQSKTKADIAVVTLNSLHNEAIEDVALEIGRRYKLGDKKLNNGAVILVVPNDRKARIETGYGLEGIINDAKAGRILDNYMIPYFRDGNYEKGIIQGTLAVAYEIAEAYGVQLSFEKPSAQKSDDADILIIIMFIIIFMIISNRNGPGGMIFFGGPRGFGGGGGGIRFGGGGGFGGGGASRGW